MALRPSHLNTVWRRRLVVAGIVGVVAALALVVGVALARRGPHGAASPDAVVARYVSALQVGDRTKLADIADPDYRSERELDPLIQRLGHGRFTVTGTAINSTAADAMKSATLTGALNDEPFADTIWLHRHGTRWYVAIGPNRNSTPKGIGSS